MTPAPALAAFLPQGEAEFQALWYYTIILAGVAVLAGVGSWFTGGTVRALWRAEDRSTAVLIATVTGVMVLLLLIMAVMAVVGLASQPATGAGAP